MKKTILILTHSYPLNEDYGYSLFAHQLARQAYKNGHDVHVLIPHHEELQNYEDINVHTFHYSNNSQIENYREVSDDVNSISPVEVIKFIYHQFREAQNLHSVYNFDLVHVHWAIPSGVAALGLKYRLGIPYIIHSHGRDVYNEPKYGYDVPCDFKSKIALQTVISRADHFIANSKETLERSKPFGADNINNTVLPFGVDLDEFNPINKNSNLYHRKCPPDHTFLFFAGKLIKRKGVDSLISAVMKCNQPVYLAIAGRGPRKKELVQLADNAEDIEFIGYLSRDDLSEYMATADIMVVPSLMEPFGIINIEALASGTPVIGSNIGGMKDIIDSNIGRKFEPGDSDELAKKIDELAADQEQLRKLSENARQRALEQYTWDRVGSMFHDTYLSV